MRRLCSPLFAMGVLLLSGAGEVVAQPRPDRPNPFSEPPRGFEPQSGKPAQVNRNQQIHFASSDDGLTFKETSDPIMKRASAADIIELSQDLPSPTAGGGQKGNLVIYCVDARKAETPGQLTLVRLFSTDGGQNWSGARPVVIHWPGGQAKGTPVDPSIVQLEGGRLRMYYHLSGARPAPRPSAPPRPSVNPPGKQKPRPSAPPRRPDRPTPQFTGAMQVIGSAISDDGVNFTPEDGHRFELEGISSPEVVRFGEEWLMFFTAGSQTRMARSQDGLTFDLDTELELTAGTNPGVVVLPDDRLRVYLSAVDGISSYLVNIDNGQVVPEAGLRSAGASGEAAVFATANGRYVMVLRRLTDEKGPGSSR